MVPAITFRSADPTVPTDHRMTPALFLLATILHLAPAVWMSVYAGLDAAWSAAFGDWDV